jgi:type IV pilus assembly protein PilC
VGELGEKHRLHFKNPLARVKMKDKVVFAGSLSAMLGSGLSLGRALAVLQRQVRNKRLQTVISDISSRINSGGTLSSALAANTDVFPPVFIAMVGAGEESGKLPESLEIVRAQMAKAYDLRRKVKGAMIYPAVILVVIIAIAVLMMIFLVPTLTSLFRELHVELPLSTRIVIAISDFLSHHTFLFLGGLLVFVVIMIQFVRSHFGSRLVTRVALRLPGLGTIIKNLNAGVTMRTLSSLISSGVSMLEALAITQKVIQNPFYQAILAEAAIGVEKGAPLSETFHKHENLYPILVGEMTEVGEETGNLPGMLLKGAAFFEDEVDQATKNLSTIIEPALMVLIGVCVGFFAVSMLGPMYSLSDAI